MDNALIDDRRIHVDFSQSVAKLWSQYRRKDSQMGRGMVCNHLIWGTVCISFSGLLQVGNFLFEVTLVSCHFAAFVMVTISFMVFFPLSCVRSSSCKFFCCWMLPLVYSLCNNQVGRGNVHYQFIRRCLNLFF